MHPRDLVLQSDWRHPGWATGSQQVEPPMLPGSFLPRTERGNEPGDEATHTSLVVQVVGKVLYETKECYLGHSEALTL